MRLLPALILLAVLIVPSAMAQDDCIKRIHVYMDVSRSMTKTMEGEDTTPYQKTLDALRSLLIETDGFLGENDEMRIVFFGDSLEEEVVHGHAEAEKAIAYAYHRKGGALTTDFRKVLEDIEVEAKSETPSHQQIFFIASDFAHDPGGRKGTPLAHQRLADWQKFFPGAEEALSNLIVDEEQSTLALMIAPARGINDPKTQKEIVPDLKRQLVKPGDAHEISGFSPKRLAENLLKRFTFPISVKATRSMENPQKVTINLRNNNCHRVEIASLSIRCLDELHNPLGDFRLIDSSMIISPLGPFENRQLQIPLRDIECSDLDEYYEVAVLTNNGIGARDQFSKDGVLEYETDEILRENLFVLGDVVHIYIGLRGELYRPKEFDIRLVIPNRPDFPIVEGAFTLSPGKINLEKKKFNPFRFNMHVGTRAASILNQSKSVRVEIRGATPAGRGPTGGVRKPFNLKVINIALWVPAILFSLAFLYFMRTTGNSSTSVVNAANITTISAAFGIPAFVQLAYVYFVTTVRWIPDIKCIAIPVLMWVIVMVFTRILLSNRIRQELIDLNPLQSTSSDMELTSALERERRSISQLNSLPILIGFLAAVVTVITIWILISEQLEPILRATFIEVVQQ
jgi:hypothetical protein